MKKTQINEKICCVVKLSENILLKMSILHKMIYKFNTISIKIPIAYFREMEEYSYNMNTMKDLNYQRNPEKEEQRRCVTLPNFKLYYKSTIIKIVWYWHKNIHRPMEQDGEHRHEPTHSWSMNLLQGFRECTLGKE